MPTEIEWVKNPDGTKGETWNPVTGCTPVSPGCANCYARRMARRLAGRYGYPEAPHHFDVTTHFNRLKKPYGRKRPTTYFVCSMGDLFHEDVPDEFLFHVFDAMTNDWTCHHTFQVLTKRPERMARWIADNEQYLFLPLLNVWLGVTAENQQCADERREYLRQCPAAVKFVSYEPALGPVDWSGWEFINQIISGGESGPKARPSHPDWHRETRDFCQANGIAYFFKQWGEWFPRDQWEYSPDLLLPDDCWCDTDADTRRWPDCSYSHRVGKKLAGRELDGRLWEEMPIAETRMTPREVLK